MSRLGMDVTAIREMAGRLDGQAQRLAEVMAAIDGIVGRVDATWHGPDALAFMGWWRNQHRPAMQRAQQSVAGLASSARHNADEQAVASGVSGGATGVLAGGAAGVTAAVGAGAAAASSAKAASGDTSSSAGRDAVVAKFVAAYPTGSTVGPGDSKGQCVGLFEEYSMKYVHTPEFFTGPYGNGACDLYTHFNDIPGLSSAYSQLPADAAPQPGDVAVWDSSTPYSGGYGHVAIVTGVSGTRVDILQQNAVPNQVSAGSFTEGEPHLLGYLRPKNLG